jgi:hypothetical protein
MAPFIFNIFGKRQDLENMLNFAAFQKYYILLFYI